MTSTTTKVINGVTVKIQTEGNIAEDRFKLFTTLESAVNYMTKNDVFYKPTNIAGIMHTLSIEKTDEANENDYENLMKINNRHFTKPDLPTDMWK